MKIVKLVFISPFCFISVRFAHPEFISVLQPSCTWPKCVILSYLKGMA